MLRMVGIKISLDKWLSLFFYIYKFILKGGSGDYDTDPVFLHLQFEAFRSVYIPRTKDKDEIKVSLMTPPNKTKYFYTIQDE